MSSKQFYFLSQLNVNELNFLLQSISDRLDAIEGQRGNPEIFSNLNMQSNLINSVASPVDLNDAAILETITDSVTAALSTGLNATFGNVTITTLTAENATITDTATIDTLDVTDITISGFLELEDGTATIIHSFGAA
jgi:hypothetical protein